MQYLIYSTLEEAIRADSIAFSHLKQSSNAQGGSWSGIFTNGKDFAILFDSCIAGAFPKEDPVESEDYAAYAPEVIESEIKEDVKIDTEMMEVAVKPAAPIKK